MIVLPEFRIEKVPIIASQSAKLGCVAVVCVRLSLSPGSESVLEPMEKIVDDYIA